MAQALGNLGLRQSFKIGQQQSPPLFVRQLAKSSSHDLTCFGSDQLPGSIEDLIAAGLLVGVDKSRPRSQHSQTIQSTTACNCNQPGKGASARRIEIIRPAPNLQKCFLENVLRLVAVMQYTQNQAKQD